MTAEIDTRKGTIATSGGRGGAGNTTGGNGGGAFPGVEYIDGGMYREGVAGENGEPYSTGRGGLGNIGGGSSSKATSLHNGAASRTSIDRYPSESVRNVDPTKPTTAGRGGAGNIGEVTSQDVVVGAKETVRHGQSHGAPIGAPIESHEPHHVETNPKLESGRLERKLSHLGLADKIKFGLFPMTKKQ